MSFLSDLGVGDLGINFSGIVSGLSTFVQYLIIAILGGALFGLWYYSKLTKKQFNKKIPIFEEINGRFVHRPKLDDVAMEMNIPETSVKVFYLKNHGIYLPRGTIMMADGEYWYGIRKNREWVNFSITNLNKEMKTAGLDYDHTDMRYANTQLKKLLARTYKKQKWYQEWKNEIAIVIIILMLTFSFWFLIGKINEVQSSLVPSLEASRQTMEAAKEVLGNLDNICGGSGFVTAGG